MNSVFYDPANKQITVALMGTQDMAVITEEDGSVLVTFENVEDIEFFWPDDRIWRAVK
jgi:tRNA(Phe) wybutosine-synthesizing methylase Tyw3